MTKKELRKMALEMWCHPLSELRKDGGDVKVMKADDLLGMETMCGDKPNHAFDQETIDFLKQHGVTEVGVILMLDDPTDPHSTVMAVGDMSADMKFADAEALVELIGKKGGSLRADGEDGAVGFESE